MVLRINFHIRLEIVQYCREQLEHFICRCMPVTNMLSLNILSCHLSGYLFVLNQIIFAVCVIIHLDSR